MRFSFPNGQFGNCPNTLAKWTITSLSPFCSEVSLYREVVQYNMEVSSKGPCSLWCFPYNSNILVIVATIIVIDMLFPSVTLEHLTCMLWVLWQVSSGGLRFSAWQISLGLRRKGKPGLISHKDCTPWSSTTHPQQKSTSGCIFLPGISFPSSYTQSLS